jgi:CheY-like chemotaxis protein
MDLCFYRPGTTVRPVTIFQSLTWNRMKSDENKFSILLADDSENDRLFLRHGMRNHPRCKIVAEVENGEEAIAYLAGAGKYHDRKLCPFPDLLVLDLRMPRLSGFDVLRWLRQQNFPALRALVHSGSMLTEDSEQALALGAHAYRTKAASLEEQRQIVTVMEALLQEAVEKWYADGE